MIRIENEATATTAAAVASCHICNGCGCLTTRGRTVRTTP